VAFAQRCAVEDLNDAVNLHERPAEGIARPEANRELMGYGTSRATTSAQIASSATPLYSSLLMMSTRCWLPPRRSVQVCPRLTTPSREALCRCYLDQGCVCLTPRRRQTAQELPVRLSGGTLAIAAHIDALTRHIQSEFALATIPTTIMCRWWWLTINHHHLHMINERGRQATGTGVGSSSAGAGTAARRRTRRNTGPEPAAFC
jgi:hypothetical protein